MTLVGRCLTKTISIRFTVNGPGPYVYQRPLNYFSQRNVSGGGSFSGQKLNLNQDEGQLPPEGGERLSHDPKDEEFIKSEILTVALKHVNAKGWNVNAISAAAVELNLAPSVSGIFKDYDLVRFFITKNNLELEEHLSRSQLNVRDAVEWRLRKVVPYVNGYAEAVAIAAQPFNVNHSVKLVLQLADSVAYHSLKDTSTDLNWYTKRMTIGALYVSTEMCLLQDNSEGQVDTWKFLDRRAEELKKFKNGELALSSLPMPDIFQAGFATLRNLLGKNAPR